MTKKIVLIGAGGFGREVASIIQVLNMAADHRNWEHPYELLGFLDDSDEFHEGMLINGLPWLGKKEWILDHKDEVVCNCTIATPKVKRKIQDELTAQGVEFETIVAV